MCVSVLQIKVWHLKINRLKLEMVYKNKDNCMWFIDISKNRKNAKKLFNTNLISY